MKFFKTVFNMLLKVIAMLVPLATAVAVIVNQMITRKAIFDCEQSVVTAFSQMDQVSTNINPEIESKIIEAVKEMVNYDLKTSLDLLIGLFGVVISVWVGLNIYNVLKKDDLRELSERIDQKCHEYNIIQLEAKETKKRIDKVYKHHRELHNSYLYKSFDVNNNSSQYFYTMFQNIDASSINYQFILNATFLETIYAKITFLHNKNEHNLMSSYLKEGVEKCKKLQNILLNSNSLNNSDKNKLFGYILYRRARLHFYEANRIYFTKKNYDKCRDIVSEFLKSIESFKESMDFDKEIEEKVNVYNTLGYIYIKIYELISNREVTIYSADELLEFAKAALDYCIKSCKKHSLTVKSVKNLGIAYERNGQIENAIYQYEEAIKIDRLDYSSRICLASAYIKMAKKKMGFIFNREKLLFEMSINKSEEVTKFLDCAKKELDIAYKIDSKALNYYYKEGELYTCYYLLEDDPDKKEGLKEYAIKQFDISKSLNDGFVAHRFHERNYYEAIGDIEKANCLNNNLDGHEKNHLKKLYENYLKQNERQTQEDGSIVLN